MSPRADPVLVTIGRADDVPPGDQRHVEVNGRTMIVAHTDRGFRVFAKECPHEWVDLIDGYIEDGVIVCAQHLYEFDLDTGECVTPLVWCSALRVLPVRVVDGDLVVEVATPAGELIPAVAVTSFGRHG